MEGTIIPLSQMETRHMFMCAKMYFNHLAEAHGGRIVGNIKHYPVYQRAAKLHPEMMIPTLGMFLREIARREDFKDLSRNHQAMYKEMIDQLTPGNIFLPIYGTRLLKEGNL